MTQRVSHATLVELLALTLGPEKGQSIWTDAVRGLSIPAGDSYTREQAMAVLQALASAPGTIGLAARVARLRLDSDETPRRGPDSSDTERSTRAPSSSQRGREPMPSSPASPLSGAPSGPMAVDVLAFLTPSLGEDKAAEAVQQYAKTLRMNAASLSRAEAVDLLDAMSTAAGLLGVVARFAKVRFLLRYPA